MKNFFSYLFSRQMLAFMALLVLGAVIWFVGPLLAVGGLQPLATVAMRITVIIMLLVFILALLQVVAMHVVGIAALCLLIWHGGPLLTIAAAQPFTSVMIRALMIAAILLVYGGYWCVQIWKAVSANKSLMDPFLRKPKEGSANDEQQGRENSKAVEGIALRSLAQIKATYNEAHQGISRLRSVLEGKRYLYDKPWYVVIGKPGTGKTSALINSGLNFVDKEHRSLATHQLAVAGQGGTAHCDWWLMKEAVLLDTAGRYASHESNAAQDKTEWHSFLGLLRKHRTRAPINGAIVSLDMGQIIMQTEEARLAYAAQLSTRLNELRTELGIRFPIYVMVTKMDLLEGFNDYFKTMTADVRAQVWGFTLPHVDTVTQSTTKGKVKSATENTTKNTSDENFTRQLTTQLQALSARIEDGVAVCLQETKNDDACRALFALPQEFSSVLAPLTQVVNEMVNNAAYTNLGMHHNLRGVYFTSTAQEGISLPANSQTLLQRLRRTLSNFTLPKYVAPISTTPTTDTDEAAVNQDEQSVQQEITEMYHAVADSHRAAFISNQPQNARSYFLSDLFSKVIIPEAHLVRPNAQWEWRFRLFRLIGHAFVIVMFLWLAGGVLLSFDHNASYFRSVADKSGHLKQRVSALFSASGSEKMLMVPDTLGSAQELPLYRGLDLDDPAASFRYGLYSVSPVADAAHNTYMRLQDSLLLPEIIRRMEEVLTKAINNKDSETAYDTLRVYLQLHDKAHYNANDVKAWVTHDWSSSDSATVFGSRSTMTNHVNQLFSGDRIVQAPFLENEELIQDARDFLGNNPSAQRLYDRAKSAMQKQASQGFTIINAVGPQAGTVFSRASGEPLENGVPGIFTYDGYHDLLGKHLQEFVNTAQLDDAWVMGNSSAIASIQKKAAAIADNGGDDDAVTLDVRRQYLNEYAEQWEKYLADIRTISGSSLKADLEVLRAFSAPDSPLSRLARAAAKETTLSRPLVTKNDDDKSLLDKAADKITNKSRAILGISPQERLEKELVDNRFAALREVITGQADAGQSKSIAGAAAQPAMENITGLLNQYYTLLVVADTALNANSLPQGTAEAGMKLKLEGDKLPAPFKAIITSLADSGTKKISDSAATILSKQAEQQLSRINSMMKYQVTDICQASIADRYPFVANAKEDVSVDDFTRVFAAGGAADEFFQKQLAPFVDTSARPWKYKNPSMINPMTPAEIMATGLGAPTQGAAAGQNNEPTLLGELLKLLAKSGPNPDTFARMQTIREAFFRTQSGKTVSWKMDVKVKELDPTILELIMDFDGQAQRYAHGPVQALTINWPGTRSGTMTEITATPRIRPDTSTIMTTGPWALFHLLDRGKLQASTVNRGRAAIEFDFDGRKAVLEMDTGSLPNPLTSNMFKSFSCPGSYL